MGRKLILLKRERENAGQPGMYAGRKGTIPFDRLLLGILSAYEDLKQKNGPDCARLWFLNCYRKLDAYFVRNKKNGFRFMYFKSLE